MGTSHCIEGVFDEIDVVERLAELRAGLVAALDDDPDIERWLHPAGDVPDGSVPESLIDQAVRCALVAIQALIVESDAQLDRDGLERLVLGIERVRRCAESAAVAVAGVVDERNPFVTDGFRNGKNWIRHRARLSRPEAFRRIQSARMHRRLRVWRDAAEVGDVGVAQSQLMAQIAANPRIDDHLLAAHTDQLLDDAIRLPYAEFEERARRWEMLADPTGTAEQSERLRTTRGATLVAHPGGGWTLTARFDDIGGEEFHNVFNHFTSAESEFDWAEAAQASGDDSISPLELRRTEQQRRADALLNIANAAAACPPDGVRPVPTLDYLIDDETFGAAFNERPVPLERYRDVVCRTNTGRPLDPHEVVKLVYWAEIRRAVLDPRGVMIDLGRKRRCFTGAARAAAQLLALECDWPGCDVPARRCQVDHVQSWARHGTTDQGNGRCNCGWHNRLKERGYRVHRDDTGTWHTYHPDGHEIL